MGIRVIADSCCDTDPEMDNRLGDLLKAPLKVLVDDTPYIDTGAQTADLLAKMKSARRAIRSACPSPEEFASLIRQAAPEPDDACIAVTLSAKLSGSYNAARNARDLLLETAPEKPVYIVDSRSASAGETRLALFIQERLDAGDSAAEAARKGETFAAGMRTLFVLEDLGNLVKNGRLNKVSGIVASILSLCPILGDDGQGEIKMVAKARGIQNALRKLLDVVNQQTAGVRPRSMTMVMAHCHCAARAGALRTQILASCPAFSQVYIVPTGALSTMYANEGGIVVAF